MKRGFTVIELIVVLVGAGIIAAILFPVFTRKRCEFRKPACQSNLKNIGLGFQQYFQDYDAKFPQSRQGMSGRGWADSLDPYIKSGRIYKCWSSSPGTCDTAPYDDSPHVTDYFMNNRVSGLPTRRLASTSLCVVNGEGLPEMTPLTPSHALDSIPAAWVTDLGSPPNRHLQGSNFGFADGHVKWFQSTRLPGTGSAAKGITTFVP